MQRVDKRQVMWALCRRGPSVNAAKEALPLLHFMKGKVDDIR